MSWPDPVGRPFWPDLSGQAARIQPFWPDGRNTVALIWANQIPSPDSGDIDRMLSDFGASKISVMVDCLK
jgi:hypothetical protein